MSKTALLFNGENSSDVERRADANIDMVPVNDISCAKRLDILNSKDSGQGLLNYSCDFDHIYASNMDDGEKQKSVNSEIALLKKIILSQVNLIQHHSLQLVTKDKKINALLEENEMLKSRLERMDRRVTLQKQKDAPECNLPVAHSTPSATIVSQRPMSSGSPLIATQVLTTLNSSLLKIENDATCTPCPVRKRKREDNGSICSATSKRTNRSSSWNGILERDDTSTPTAAAATINGKSAKLDSSQRTKRRRRLKNDEAKREQNKDILLTNVQYYTTVGNEEDTILDLMIDAPKVNGCVLEVPCWRQRLFSSCYTMEGTENLSEDVFHKRHARLEIDERRRKRWDVQRIREQRQLEKLRQRERRNNAGEDYEELYSLWPTCDDVGAVDISPMLPVAAFGYNIPKFPDSKPIEFSLPWIGSEKTFNHTTLRLRHNSAKQKERASIETRNIFEKSILVDQKRKGK
ncbi:male-specific lethal 1 homolog [Nilaparvata lugens]|uniref:male-specific lethal 1 homolog n=1 Tax=Nilaparvata lugens TaxID=108931 RepID=UPI00193D87AA|nr:male-specific lethal 1 homolog [Nilaparvata lugens]